MNESRCFAAKRFLQFQRAAVRAGVRITDQKLYKTFSTFKTARLWNLNAFPLRILQELTGLYTRSRIPGTACGLNGCFPPGGEQAEGGAVTSPKAQMERSPRLSEIPAVIRNGRPTNRSGVWAAGKRLRVYAGAAAEKAFPHNLRRLFVRFFYKQHKGIVGLADVLGRSNANGIEDFGAERITRISRGAYSK